MVTLKLSPRVREFSARYGVWILAFVFVDAGLWFAFDRVRPRPIDGVQFWTLRLLVVSGILWLNNLFVLWWYAHRTEQQYALSVVLRREANKPVAVIDHRRVLASNETGPEHDRYVVRNIGPGLAVNVFHVTRQVDNRVGGPFVGPVDVKVVGALEAHGERLLPLFLEHSLQEAVGYGRRVVIVAEGLVTRTARWTVTANALGPSGELMHRLVSLPKPEPNDRLNEWLERHWEQLNQEFAVAEVEAGR